MSDCGKTGHHFVVTSRVKEGDVIIITEHCRWCCAERVTREATW